MKKVLYLIYSSTPKAGGGHFYSLKTISHALSNDINYKIINLGYTFADVLREDANVYYYRLIPRNFFFEIWGLISIVNDFNPDVIHAFDDYSLFISRFISLFHKSRLVYTKCGGQNPSGRFFPVSDTQIFFSKENFDFYSRKGNPKIPKYLLPNRVSKVKMDLKKVEELKVNNGLNNKFVLLRISRFSRYYELTFNQSINLLKEFQKIRNDAVLVFLGKVQDIEYFKELKAKADSMPIYFLSDEYYTKNASQIIGVADVIIATGRGAMEASSLNKIIFCPVKNSSFPIVMNHYTFDKLFATNFSERVEFDQKFILEQNFNAINYQNTSNTYYFFEKYFSLDNVKHIYLDIYDSVKKIKFNPLNFIIHLVLFMKR